MQYSVRNRRKLRQTGEIGIPRTMTVRGTGVANVEPPVATTESSAVEEITPAPVIKNTEP